MIKAYFEILPGKPLLPVVYAFGTENDKYLKNVPFIKQTLAEITEKFIERADTAAVSEVVVIPHAWEYIKNETVYLTKIRELAEAAKKQVVIFSYEDFFELPDWPGVIAFCPTGYRSELPANQIVMPYLVQDFSRHRQLVVRELPTVPIIGFVGWGKFDTWKQEVRSRIKDFLELLKNIASGKTNLGIRRKGLLMRVKLLKQLTAEAKIQTNFIVRGTYGASAKVVSPEALVQGREEFITNVINSDVVLAPRGEGNSSQRFYEALSLGRFPVLIDTDVPLPLADIIDYNRLMVRVPYKDRWRVAEYVKKYFSQFTPDTYKDRQREAQTTFTRYLSANGFYTYMFVDGHIRKYLIK